MTGGEDRATIHRLEHERHALLAAWEALDRLETTLTGARHALWRGGTCQRLLAEIGATLTALDREQTAAAARLSGIDPETGWKGGQIDLAASRVLGQPDGRTRAVPRLPGDLYTRARLFCRERGLSFTDCLAEAVERHLTALLHGWKGDAGDGRRCRFCDAPLRRRPAEQSRNWEERRYCDLHCAGAARGHGRRRVLTDAEAVAMLETHGPKEASRLLGVAATTLYRRRDRLRAVNPPGVAP